MKRILWRDNFRRITENNGQRFVSVEWDRSENHMSNRADALQVIRKQLGEHWHITSFVGLEHMRRFDGRPATYRRYSIARTDSK